MAPFSPKNGMVRVRIWLRIKAIKNIFKHYIHVDDIKCKYRHKLWNTNQVLTNYLQMSKLFWSQEKSKIKAIKNQMNDLARKFKNLNNEDDNEK